MDCVTNMIEFQQISVHDYRKGNFSLHFDCVLKVVYRQPSAIRWQLFVCRMEDSPILVSFWKSLFAVRAIEVSTIDDFDI